MNSQPSRRVQIHNGFTPYPYQADFMQYLESGGKRAMCVWHRRSGKDLTALHQTCRMAHKRVGQYWHVFPTFSQGRKAVWEGFTKDGRRIIDMAFPPELIKSSNQSEMKIEFKNGSIWHLIGSDKIEVVGAGPVGVVFSEFAMARPMTWQLIRPMLRENGGWAVFITTPRGPNHAFDLYQIAGTEPGWFRSLLTIHDTKTMDPEKTLAEEKAGGMPEALIRQEYLCDWTAANVGSVFGDLVEGLEKNGRVVAFDVERDGVYTSWDIGHDDATAIWFWRLNENRMPDLIDHYEMHGKPASHYFDIVDSKPYKYTQHYLPHDARAKTFQTGASTIELALEHWPNLVAIGPQLSIEDGIQAARWLLQQKMRIHAGCAYGLKALRHYHYKYDEDTKSYAVRPLHDWSSHTADAFRYLACVVKHTDAMSQKPKGKTMPAARSIDSFTLDELWALRERNRH